jgi:ketosteroid isomerase-like protein
MTDDETKHRLASDFLAGLMSDDLDRMRSSLHPEATWSVPGETAISGLATGADAIIERVRAITSSGDVSIHLEHVLYGRDNVAVALHNTGQRGDVRLDEQVIIVFTLANGKISAAENLITDVPGLNAFFAASD